MKNIFVGNLSFSATESSIRALFEPYGAIDRGQRNVKRESCYSWERPDAAGSAAPSVLVFEVKRTISSMQFVNVSHVAIVEPS